MWHKKTCLLGQCGDCGVERKLLLCLLETNPCLEELVSWQHYDKVVVRVNKEELSKKIVTWIYKEIAPVKVVECLRPLLHRFIKHNFVAQWQDAQARTSMSTIMDGQLIFHIDFSKNYTFQPQNDVQSEYYYNISITILVHITYRIIVNSN